MARRIRREQASKRDRISTKVHDRVAMARVEAAIRSEEQWLESASRGLFSAIPGEIGPCGSVVLA